MCLILFRLTESFIQLLISCFSRKKLIKRCVQLLLYVWIWLFSKLAEFPIKVPVIIQKSFQLFLVIRHYWPQFLVVSPIMNPTKSMVICNLLELRCIITQKCGNHRYVCTLMICSNCTGFKNFLLGSLISIRRENIIEFSTHFFVTEYFVFNRREFFHPDLGNIKRFHKIKCFIIKVVLFFFTT